jgi:hypothetical protein
MVRAHRQKIWWRIAGCAIFAAAWLASPARADEAPDATIKVASATAGSSLGNLVQGVMTFQGDDYILILRGVAGPAKSTGSVPRLLRARDIEGVYKPSGEELRSESGVAIRFDPPLPLAEHPLEIEIQNRVSPKVSGGEPGSGVEE